MKDYVLNNKPEPAANETVWAFDQNHPLRLERGEDRGEVSNPGHQKTAVQRGNEFGHPCSSRRNLPCPVGESAAPAFVGLGPGFSHGAKPKPPPVAAGCGARGWHTRRVSNGWKKSCIWSASRGASKIKNAKLVIGDPEFKPLDKEINWLK